MSIPPGWMKAFGHVLAHLRKRAGLNQVEAAEQLGISQPTLSRIERGLTDVKLLTFRTMLLLYKTDMDRVYEQTRAVCPALVALDAANREPEPDP